MARLADVVSPSDTELWLSSDVLIYRRRSDPGKAGNVSLLMQEESVPARIEQVGGCSLAEIQARGGLVSIFEDEDISGRDADAHFEFSTDGVITLTGHKRQGFTGMLGAAYERWRATGRRQIVCGFTLNRLGRSGMTVEMLRRLANKMRGALLVWTQDQAGQFVRPETKAGAMLLLMAIDYAGSAESDTKRDFVGGAKDHIAEKDASRSLSERAVGYRRYPCDVAGRRLDDLSAVPDHYRLEVDPTTAPIAERAFSLAQSGTRPRQIAQALQAAFGNHPVNGRRWTRTAVSWMLRNPLYIGQRLYKRRSSFESGSGQRFKLPENEQKRSPYCGDLRIIADDAFYAVQRRLDEWAGQRREDGRNVSMGRPLKLSLYFHRTELLKCGVCGHALTVVRHGEKYTYRCLGLAERGYPMCQSHDAPAVDESMTATVADMFGSVAEYRKAVERDLSKTRNAGRLAALQAELKPLEAALEETKAAFYASLRDSDMGTFAKKAIADDLETKSAAFEAKRMEIARFGQTEGDKTKAEVAATLRGIEAFPVAPFPERKAILQKLVDAVWLWPDGVTYLQMRGEKLESARVNALKLTGRTIGEGKQWGAVDFLRLEADTKRLIDDGEIPQEAFLDLVSNATTYNWLTKGRQVIPSTLIRLYKRATAQYVDMARLRADVAAWLAAEVAAGTSWYRLEKVSGVAKGTLQKLHAGGPVRRDSFVKMAHVVGGLEPYTALPSWLYQPEHLDDVATMIEARKDAKSAGEIGLTSPEVERSGT